MRARSVHRDVMLAVAVAWLSAAAPAGAGLRLELASQLQTIAPLEALPITVSLTNDGAEPVENLDPLAFTGAPGHLVQVTRPDGTVMTIHQAQIHLEQVEHSIEPRLTLAPGETATVSWPISFDWDFMKPIFDAEGHYSISATYVSGAVKLDSNTIGVTVQPPPARETEALEVVRTIEHPEVLQEPGLTLIPRWSKGVEDLARVAQLRGSTLYASYARLALAKRHTMLARGQLDPDRSVSELTTAAQLLKRVDPTFTLGPERDRTLATVKRMRRRLHRRIRAR
jgi:hypothetical protein